MHHAESNLIKMLMCYSFISLDSGCSSKTTTGNIVRLFVEDKVDAFIGPPCSQGLYLSVTYYIYTALLTFLLHVISAVLPT